MELRYFEHSGNFFPLCLGISGYSHPLGKKLRKYLNSACDIDSRTSDDLVRSLGILLPSGSRDLVPLPRNISVTAIATLHTSLPQHSH